MVTSRARKSGINFASWNICRGFINKENDIRSMIEDHKIDILMLQEIDIMDYSEKLLSIPNFTTFVKKATRKGPALL